MRDKKLILLIAAGVALGSVGAGVAATNDEPVRVPGPTLQQLRDESSTGGKVDSISTDQRDAFGVFRRAAATVPMNARRQLDGDLFLTKKFGANIDLARSVPVSGHAQPALVVPGRGTVCLFVADEVGYGGTCTATRNAQNGYLALTMQPAVVPAATDEVSVIVLLPDGVSRATATTVAGVESPLVIVDNVASGTIKGDAQSLRYRVGSGPETIRDLRGGA